MSYYTDFYCLKPEAIAGKFVTDWLKDIQLYDLQGLSYSNLLKVRIAIGKEETILEMNYTGYAREIMWLIAKFVGIDPKCEDYGSLFNDYAFLMKEPTFIDFLNYCLEHGDADFLEARKEGIQETLDNLPSIPYSKYMINYI